MLSSTLSPGLFNDEWLSVDSLFPLIGIHERSQLDGALSERGGQSVGECIGDRVLRNRRERLIGGKRNGHHIPVVQLHCRVSLRHLFLFSSLLVSLLLLLLLFLIVHDNQAWVVIVKLTANLN